MHEEPNRLEVLRAASQIAERALAAATDEANSAVPLVVRETWLTANVIHCDVLRMMVALDQCPQEGIARLLWYGDMASVLIEARNWFFTKGNKHLLDITASRSQDVDMVRNELKRLASANPLSDLDRYYNYRNKVGHHYDSGLLEHLDAFSLFDAEEFFRLLTNYATYSTGWVALCKLVMRLPDAGPKA